MHSGIPERRRTRPHRARLGTASREVEPSSSMPRLALSRASRRRVGIAGSATRESAADPAREAEPAATAPRSPARSRRDRASAATRSPARSTRSGRSRKKLDRSARARASRRARSSGCSSGRGASSQVGLLRALHVLPLSRRRSAASFAAKADTRGAPAATRSRASCSPIRSSAAMTLLSTHTVYRGLLWSVGLLAADARLRPRVLRLDLPVRHAPPLLRLDLPVALRARQLARRGEQDARLPAREVLPDVRVPRRGGRGQRHRRALRSDLHRACAPSASRVHPGRAVHRRSRRSAPRRTSTERARAVRRRQRAGLPRASGLAEQAVLLPPDVVHRRSAHRHRSS